MMWSPDVTQIIIIWSIKDLGWNQLFKGGSWSRLWWWWWVYWCLM